MRLLIIRHGDPNYALDALTDYGKVQADALSKVMKDLPIDKIYSSTMGRAKETASYTAKALDMPVTTLHWTREIHLPGVFDEDRGQDVAVWNLPPWRLKATESHPEGWYNAPELSPPTAENVLNEITEGWQEFLNDYGIQKQDGIYVSTRDLPTGNTLLFCHHGFGLALLSVILELPFTFMWRNFDLHTTSVTTIDFQLYKDKVNFRIKEVGATGHLHGLKR